MRMANNRNRRPDTTDTLSEGPPQRRVWLADLTHTGRGVASDTVPLGVGYLAAYLEQGVRLQEPVRLFRYPVALAEALASEPAPDMLGFSNYSWNVNLSRRIATKFKHRNPESCVVFGGPNFPNVNRREFLLSLGADFYVENEGEEALLQLFLALRESLWSIRHVAEQRLPSVHSVYGGQYFAPSELLPRISDLDAIPSPYLSGYMSSFLDGLLVPSIQTNRGCPFSCTFCTEGHQYFNRVARFSTDRVVAELQWIASFLTSHKLPGQRNELVITDSNFAMYPQDELVCAEIGRLKVGGGWPARVNVTTGKNRRDRVLRSIGKAEGAIQLSGAVQSLDPEVLDIVSRKNIDVEDLKAVALDASVSGATTYTDVILGLPGDTLAKHKASILELIDAGFSRVNTFQFMLLAGASISTARSRDMHGLRSCYRVLSRSFGYYPIYGELTPIAEVEEVCVETNTMTFEDYMTARQFDLTVFLFHNDGVMRILEHALRLSGLKVSDWLLEVDKLEWPGVLNGIRTRYLKDTRDQLFETSSDAWAFFAANVQAFLKGNSGTNLLYSSRAASLMEGVRDLCDVARNAVRLLGVDDRFLLQACSCDEAALSGILDLDPPDPLQVAVDYNFRAITASSQLDDSRQVIRSQPVILNFVRPTGVASMLDDYRVSLGGDKDGIGRALSRVPVSDLRREIR